MPGLSRDMRRAQRGFGLLEAMMSIALFALIGLTMYQAFAGLLSAISASRQQINAMELLQEQVEIVRNLPYANVGVVSGIPSGVLTHSKTVTRSGQVFAVTTTVQNVDDTFDGTLGGSPNDLSPADYKRVEISVACTNCKNSTPVTFTTTQAPKSLETSSTNGALFVRVLNASGVPVVGASVHILNQEPSPDVIIDDVTDNDGWLKVIDAPPGVQVYEITVSKNGYSTERTYTPGAVGNPNPSKPHATVLVQQVTQITFNIDQVSTLNVSTVTDNCTPVSSVPFTLQGTKVVGLSLLKFDQNLLTSAGGILALASLEWDTYHVVLSSNTYHLIGSIPLNPIALPPGSIQNFQMVVEPKNPNALVVTVRDGATGLPIPDAMVTMTGVLYNKTLYAGRGFLGQTDWSGGAGQNDLTDTAKYFDSDGNVATNQPTGELKLLQTLGLYAASGTLTSSTFDTGSVSNFHQILWQPTGQPAQTGADSVKFQIATNNDNATWNFLGPDGTSGTYYTVGNDTINAVHDTDRYLRYKVFLSTANPLFTPNVADVNFTFTSSCVPPGQVMFSGLLPGVFAVDVSKPGYQSYNDPLVTVLSPWSEKEVILTP